MTATEAPPGPGAETAPQIAPRDGVGLNAANFFLAELTGVVIPFLAKMLADRGWRDDAIQYTAAACGLGVFLAQTPAGLFTDRFRNRRLLLAGASLVVGACFGLLPLVPDTGWFIGPLAFLGGVGQAFFVPLLGALALGIAGHAALHKVMGENQGWNHAGNIAAALTAMAVAAWLRLPAVFYTIAVVSALAAASVFLIRPTSRKNRARRPKPAPDCGRCSATGGSSYCSRRWRCSTWRTRP